MDDRNYGERLVLIVPLVGDGSPRNPFRPLFAPMPDEMQASGMIGYTAVLSDDKKFALVELVARDRKAFDAILKDTRVDVKKFDQVKGAAQAQYYYTDTFASYNSGAWSHPGGSGLAFGGGGLTADGSIFVNKLIAYEFRVIGCAARDCARGPAFEAGASDNGVLCQQARARGGWIPSCRRPID